MSPVNLEAVRVAGYGWCVVKPETGEVLTHTIACFDCEIRLPIFWAAFDGVDRWLNEGSIEDLRGRYGDVGFRTGLLASCAPCKLPAA